MHNSAFRKIVIASGAFALLLVAALWSFNALSELFGGPQAQYRHAIAAVVLLLVLKWSLAPYRGGNIKARINHRHCRSIEHKACEQ